MVGESDLKVCEDLRLWPVFGFSWQVGWSTVWRQGGADVALTELEAFPDALQSSEAQVAVGGADGGGNGTGDGELEEAPERVGSEAEPSDSVGEPDADGASTTGPLIAVAAEYATGADGFSVGTGLVESVQEAMLNESADGLAVGTVREFELFGHRAPILGAAVEPLQLAAHTDASPKKVIVPA